MKSYLNNPEFYGNYTGFNQYDYNSKTGELRYNPQSNIFEVYNGMSWIQYYPSITYAPQILDAINWIENKKIEELKLLELCDKYPTLQKAKDNFDLVFALVKDYQ